MYVYLVAKSVHYFVTSILLAVCNSAAPSGRIDVNLYIYRLL